MTRPKPKTVLQRARALLEKHWTQRKFYDEYTGSYCAIGALNAVTNKGKYYGYEAASTANAYSRKLEGLLQDALPKYGPQSVILFNDGFTTTQADVLALYDRAIELAEGVTR